MKYAATIIRVRRDGTDTEVYSSTFLVESSADTEELKNDKLLCLIRGAVNDFLNTEDGQAALEDTCGDFNWGDIDMYIPSEFLARYGISMHIFGDAFECSGVCSYLVNQDELLFHGSPNDENSES